MRVTLSLLILIALGCKQSIKTSPEYIASIAEHRTQYKSDFIKGGSSPLDKNDLNNLDFFAADENYNCKCKLEILENEQPFEVDTYAGKKKSYIRYGLAHCEAYQKKFKLAVYKTLRMMSMPGYEDFLFLPFMDHSNGESTYGGGRYIDLQGNENIQEGYINIDFNKCYNPYCAYSDGYNCPIPPVENHLDFPLEAGEKNYKGEKKQRKQ